jgi:hypothetical protein
MQYNTHIFLNELREQTETHLQMAIRDWQNLTPEQLGKTPAPGKWSAAQCLEHLNFYGRHYIPACRAAIERAQKKGSLPSPVYRPGWLGAKFTRMMQPGAKAMESPANARPAAQPDAIQMLQEFIGHNEQLLQLLGQAEKINLEKVKAPTSLSALLRLQLGDTFAFYLAHQARHVLQIQRVLGA